MKHSIIEQFNAGSAESESVFEKARNAGFPWVYFMDRAQMKASACGYLPERGALFFDARYTNSADRMVRDLFACIESVGDAHTLVGWCTPWQDIDLQRWKEVICSLSCTLFDVGVVAAFTRSPAGEEDPLARNGVLSILGDVGYEGLRKKSLALVREVAGEQATQIMEEVGDCACLHIFADARNSERVFKMDEALREAYVRNGCRAAYLAGAVFGEKVIEAARRM